MDFKATPTSKMFFNLKVLGFGDVLAQRILAHYKDNEEEVRRVLETDPYLLMRIEGIGFYRADQAAKALGMADEDPRRQKALINKLLQDNTSFGHTYLPHFMLRTKLRDNNILGGDDRLQEMIDEGTLVVETGGGGDKAEEEEGEPAHHGPPLQHSPLSLTRKKKKRKEKTPPDGTASLYDCQDRA